LILSILSNCIPFSDRIYRILQDIIFVVHGFRMKPRTDNPLRGDFFLGLSQNLIFIYPVDPVDPV